MVDEPALTVHIEKPVAGGHGLARTAEGTILVSQALPGEDVEVRIERREKGVAWATPLRLLVPHPERRQPPCPYYGECGGCSLQHASYDLQRRMKESVLQETIKRIAGIDYPVVVAPSPEFAYRIRVQLKVSRVAGKTRLGFFRAGSHEVCPVDRCLLLPEVANQALPAIASVIAAPKYRSLRAIDLLVASDDRLLLRLLFDRRIPPGVAVETCTAAKCAAVWACDQSAAETPAQHSGIEEAEIKVGDYRYLVRPDSFFQVNPHLHPAMIRALESSLEGPTNFAIDLYSGVGFFTLPLAHHFKRVLGVEENVASVRLARAAATAMGIDNVRFVASTVRSFAAGWSENEEVPDTLVVDPPRAGMAEEVIERLRRVPRLVYFSCHPAAFARDVRRWLDAGFHIAQIEAFDLFPQTPEVEVMAVLAKA